MKKRYTYAECYRILDIDPACTWDELRRAYKLQVQKWHPDRFADKTAEKDAANDKIKRITIAQQQLIAYYRQHSKLPDPETQPVPQKLPQPNRMHPNAATSSARPKRTETTAKKNRLMPAVTVLVLIGTISWLYLNSSDNSTTSIPTSTTQFNTNTNVESAQSRQVTTPMEQRLTIADEEFITYGSSIGEVITIQGAPTENIGDTWYYGESELYFEDGKVVGWKHALDSKLKTSIVTKNIP